MNPRDALATAAGFAVAGAVLLGLAALIGIDAVVAAMGRAKLGRVALVGLAIFAYVVFWSGALRAVVAALGVDVSPTDAFLVTAGSSFANHVTPFGQAGGEPVTAWLLTDVSGVDYERSLAAVTSFDTVNVVPSMTLAVVGLGYYAATAALGDRLQTLAIGVAAAVVGAPVVGLLAWRERRGLAAVLIHLFGGPLEVLHARVPGQRVPGREAIERRVEGFVVALERIAGDRRQLLVAVGFSSAGWGIQALGLWLAFWALGVPLPVHVPLFVVPLGTVAGALPTPGGLGGIETVQVGLLTAVTAVAAPTITAAVAIFSVGGFLFTTSLGAAAIVVLKDRAARV